MLSLTLSDAKGYLGTYGGYVQGESQLAITVNPTTAQGAAISSYSVSFDGKSYATQTVTTAAISGSGDLAVEATVKDTRGRTGTASQNVTVLAYSRPSITKLDVHRCNSDGTENAQGAYAKATYTFNITSLSSKNAKTIRLGYKKSSATSYTYVSITSAYTATNATKVFAAETGSSYDVVLEVTDSFGTTTRTTSVSTAAVVFHVRADGTGLSIGKVSERANAFEVGNDSYFSKGVNVTGAGTFGSVSATGAGSLGSVSVSGAGSFGSAIVSGASTFGGVATFNNTIKDKFGRPVDAVATLWTGNWTGESPIDVPNIDKYYLYIIDLDDSYTRILAVRESDKIRGIGGMVTSSDVAYIEAIGFTLSGTTLTYGGQTTRKISSSNAVSTYATGHAVLGIYGVK